MNMRKNRQKHLKKLFTQYHNGGITTKYYPLNRKLLELLKHKMILFKMKLLNFLSKIYIHSISCHSTRIILLVSLEL